MSLDDAQFSSVKSRSWTTLITTVTLVEITLTTRLDRAREVLFMCLSLI